MSYQQMAVLLGVLKKVSIIFNAYIKELGVSYQQMVVLLGG